MGEGEMGGKSDGILRELISALPQGHSQIDTTTFSARLHSESDLLIFQNLEVIEISSHRHHRGVARIIGAFPSAHYNAHPLHLSLVNHAGRGKLIRTFLNFLTGSQVSQICKCYKGVTMLTISNYDLQWPDVFPQKHKIYCDLVTSHLDYCHAVYIGLPLKRIQKLQLVHNVASGIVNSVNIRYM